MYCCKVEKSLSGIDNKSIFEQMKTDRLNMLLYSGVLQSDTMSGVTVNQSLIYNGTQVPNAYSFYEFFGYSAADVQYVLSYAHNLIWDLQMIKKSINKSGSQDYNESINESILAIEGLIKIYDVLPNLITTINNEIIEQINLTVNGKNTATITQQITNHLSSAISTVNSGLTQEQKILSILDPLMSSLASSDDLLTFTIC